MKQKDKLLIKLIQSVALENPSAGFTDNVMAFLQEESSLEEEMDTLLARNLNKDLLPPVPHNFSTDTMEILGERFKKPVFEPLLSRKTRRILICLFVLGYTLLFLDAVFFNTLYISNASVFKVDWLKEVSKIPSIFWISIFSLTILLLLDYNFRSRRNMVLEQ